MVIRSPISIRQLSHHVPVGVEVGATVGAADGDDDGNAVGIMICIF